MKKSSGNLPRILTRRMATELKREQLGRAGGGVATWSATYPADYLGDDSGGGGPIFA
jgi:hypothetical protein